MARVSALSSVTAPDTGLAFYTDVIAGLRLPQKSISGNYLWDETGSALFDQICDGGFYYATRCETALLQLQAGTVAHLVGADATVVEYGSGASHKIRVLLDALARPRRYIAIDISGEYLRAACARIARDYPRLEVTPVCADYTKPISLPVLPPPRSILGFFPGTAIGNLHPEEAAAFLSRAHQTLGESWFLVGLDPNADPSSLAPAYADPDGLMAEFHGNLLVRMQREIGGTLRPENFRHEARVLGNPLRVEAHLVAQDSCFCQVGGQPVSFRAGESIHTSTSYKYDPETFQRLATRAGWKPVQCWSDDHGLFSLHLLRG